MARGKRSPKYPFISLEKALDRAEELYRAEGRGYAPISVATSHWGYKPKSSGGLQTIAALIGYGLAEDTGSGAARKVRVSELARRILLDQREDSDERLNLIKEAALQPQIFRDLWDKCRDSGLPSPANMRHMLVFDYNFNENTADDVVRIFSDTLLFARLPDDEQVPGPLETERLNERIPQSGGRTPRVQNSPVVTTDKATMHQAMIPLPEGEVSLAWPQSISVKSYKRLIAWLDMMKDIAEDSVDENEHGLKVISRRRRADPSSEIEANED